MKTAGVFLAILCAGLFQLVPAQVPPSYSRQKPMVADQTRISPAEALRRDMRKLWSDHVIWTRDYAIAAIAGTPDARTAAARLLRNQDDIGNAVAGYYGKGAGDKLTGLLKQHILIAVDLINAAIAHDNKRFEELDRKWSRNGEEIADFLASANPNWSRAALNDMMQTHLATTKREVTARIQGNWDEDVKAFDAVYDHILQMSDALADGIIKQFPGKFPSAIS
jgi:hypothetical protein